MTAGPDASNQRSQKALRIAENPAAFKVCEGCESIVAARVVSCPSCSAYRFNDDPAAVADHAKLLGSRDRQSVIAEDFL